MNQDTRILFRILLVILSIFFTLIGTRCIETAYISDDEEKDIQKLCTKVNNENWYRTSWEGNSSKEVCHESGVFFLEHDTIPCTFGGLPYACSIKSDGTVIVMWFDRDYVAVIEPTDMERAGPHLILIR